MNRSWAGERRGEQRLRQEGHFLASFPFCSSAQEEANSGLPFGWMQASIPGSGSRRPPPSGRQGRSCRLELAKDSCGVRGSPRRGPGWEGALCRLEPEVLAAWGLFRSKKWMVKAPHLGALWQPNPLGLSDKVVASKLVSHKVRPVSWAPAKELSNKHVNLTSDPFQATQALGSSHCL
jgi:hypothetical protein